MDSLHIHKSPDHDTRPLVSIILLDWNCREQFHTLEWLTRQTVARDRYELIWIDLYDRVVPEAMILADSVMTCGQSGMYHKHKGYNLGLLHARGQVITVCDSDAVFPPEFVASIIEAFELEQRPEPKPLVLMHHEQRSNHLYPRKLENIEQVLRYDWVELWPNAGACMSVAKRDALGFGGFDEDESLRGYICGPYELGWRLVNAGIPEYWHEQVFLWHFAHPHSNAKENKESWSEIVAPHVDFHARAAVEAFSHGRLLPLTMNPEVQARRLAQRRIGSAYEAKFAAMADKVAPLHVSAEREEGVEADRWYESAFAPKNPLVSAIVSSYKGERFMRGLLEDLTSQTLGEQLEIVIIDSNSPQNEAAIVREFQSRYHNIRFMRTSVREQSHITLNRCIQAARGKYISLACVDDRHRADALEKLAASLERDTGLALAYADVAITDKENQVLESAPLIGYYRWPDFSRDTLFQVCYMGPQPLWRRDLHERYGYFDEAFMSAGDYEFWLRLAAGGETFLHLPEVLGLYLLNPQGNEHGQRDTSVRESDIAVRRYWQAAWGPRPTYGGSYFQAVVKTEQPVPATGLPPLGHAPLVSIIVPTHNRPNYLKDALDSIIAQDYPHWEAIVVNDGGVDVSQLVNALDPQGRIRYLAHTTNFGQVAAKNTGLRAARGEVICYLDDDDKYQAHHISSLVQAMRGTDVAFAYTDTVYVMEEEHEGKRREVSRAQLFENVAHTKEQLLVRNYIPINVWAHRRACLKVTGLFDESLPSLEDWELLLRFAQHWPLKHVPGVTAEVWQRTHVADNVSRRQMHTYLTVYPDIYARYAIEDEAVKAGRAEMLRSLEAALAAPAEMGASPQARETEYQRWMYKHSLQEIDGQIFAERMLLKWHSKPVIHLLLPLRAGEEQLLADTLDSLGGQLYQQWRLTVIAPFPAPDPSFNQLEVLRWVEIDAGQTWMSAAQTALDAMQNGSDAALAEWLGWLEPGVKLTPQALFSVADYINLHSEWRLIYSDSDYLDAQSQRCEPQFRPDFNLDLLRSQAYFGDCVFLARGAWDALTTSSAPPSAMRGAEAYALSLSVLETQGEAAIGHISDILYSAPATTGHDDSVEMARRSVLQTHLQNMGVAAQLADGYLPNTTRLLYEHAAQPWVSVIVPTKDRIEVLEPCINGLLQKTAYPNLEIIIVDNQSSDPDVLDYLNEIAAQHADRVRVLRFPQAFNFAAICNLGAQQARGEYILFMNNDVHVVQSEWLSRMLQYAQRPEVGIVGARLIFPETGKLQHAGMVLGLAEVADHPYFQQLGIDTPGYMGRTHVDQNVSGVTGGCMLVRKAVYEEVRGMDESTFLHLYGDVDLCLKVGRRGYKIVWTPYATLVHHNAATRQREELDLSFKAKWYEQTVKETHAMFERWLPQLAHDPAYNRNLSLIKTDYRVEDTVVIDWDTQFHDRPRFLGVPLVGGSGEYRICAPFRALNQAGKAKCDVVETAKYAEMRILSLPELARADPDSLVVHAAISDAHLAMLETYKRFHRSRRIFAMDDLITNVPEHSPFHKHAFRDAKARLRKALSYCDRAIVTTQPLVDLCQGLNKDIRLIPNYLEKARWGGLHTGRQQSKKPRVGWAGAQQHHGDLALVVDLVKATAHEVDWVFFGMCLQELKPYIKEEHPFILDFDAYPKKLASLQLDIAIAPLQSHPFNEAKSNLRLLEYGALGMTVICSDIYPYQNAPVKRVADDSAAWIEALRDRIYDLDAAGVEGDCLRRWVHDNYMLEDHLDEWFKALSA